MSVIDKLASSLHRRDEAPNKELARQIVGSRDKKAIKELVANLGNSNRKIQSDCIKVLYEAGALAPALISGYAREFIELLSSKDNRLQWGAMTVLDAITLEVPAIIYAALGEITAAADKGSVITKDHCVSILIMLCSVKQYAADAFVLFLEQLTGSPANQLPMYAEQAMPVVNSSNKMEFIRVLTLRLPGIEKDTKRARVEKVIKKISSL